MRGLFTLLLVIWLGQGAFAQSSEIQDTISGQMEAFENRDVARAFSFASPGIQGIFQSPERFGSMVRQGYPMVWDPGQIRFGELREEDGRPVQRVDIMDEKGKEYSLDYLMVETQDGWRIDGVWLRPPPDPAV